MIRSRSIARVVLWAYFCVLALFPPATGHAYIDPGTTGVISQILYVLFYGVLGIGVYYVRRIKSSIARAKQFLAQRFGRRH